MPPPSSSSDFNFRLAAEAVLDRIEQLCDTINDRELLDIDNQRTGSMLTLTFPDTSQIIINLQPPLQEVWLACIDGGFHFRYNGSYWQDTKSDTEFFSLLSQQLHKHSNFDIDFIAYLGP